jgi:hypothetical protein
MTKKELLKKIKLISQDMNEDYDTTKDCLVDDYEHILEDNNITHIVEYNRDTQDFNVAYELGYLRALEIVADRFTEIEKEVNKCIV